MVGRGPGYKKFKTPPARAACTSCRASRVRCSGTSPCFRCEKKARSCVFTTGQQGHKLKARTDQDSTRGYLNKDGTPSLQAIDPTEYTRLDATNDFVVQNDCSLLPPLFNDNVDAFQFDDIFLGHTESDLDSFFADIFSLPTFPRLGVDGPTPFSTTPQQHLVHGYHSDGEVLQSYYHLVHPIFPILPPPTEDVLGESDHMDGSAYQPSSALVLALLALLTQLAPSDNPDNVKIPQESRIELSQRLAQCALEAICTKPVLKLSEFGSFSASAYHPQVPLELEAPMAYCVLSLYQYLCWGNVDEMTFLAQKAFTFFEDIIQATETPLNELSPFDEALRRAWWMTYMCICNASTISCKPPPKPINVDSVRIPYPSIGRNEEVWSRYIRAEESLLAATLLLVALVKGFDTQGVIAPLNRSLKMLGELISHQLALNSAVALVEWSEAHSAESRLAFCFHILTRVRLMSAHIKVHRYRAFMNDSRMLRSFETIASTSESQKQAFNEPAGLSFNSSKVRSIFPFQEGQAQGICLESASTIANDLKQLMGARTIAAPSVCSAMIAGYTLMMMSHFKSSASSTNLSLLTGRKIQTQCEFGIKTAVEVLDSYSTGSEFLKGLRDQLHTAATACILHATHVLNGALSLKTAQLDFRSLVLDESPGKLCVRGRLFAAYLAP